MFCTKRRSKTREILHTDEETDGQQVIRKAHLNLSSGDIKKNIA